MLKRTTTILIILLIPVLCKGSDFGSKFGLIFQFGTHIQRIGLSYQLYYYDSFYQLNQGAAIYFNRRNLGPKISSKEFQTFAGFHISGDQTNQYKTYINEYSLMNSNKYSGGYNFRWYWNDIQTTQATGELVLHFDEVSFLFQNDILGFIKGHEDKYRTGAFAFLYTKEDKQLALQSTTWTGKCSKAKKVKDSDYPARYGYKDLRDAHYGRFSHGIMAFRYEQAGNFSQSYNAELGIDAEQIRHLFQNRMVHDMIIRSKDSKLGGNPHVPMLQENGLPYLFEDGEKVRKPKLYLQGGVNGYLFY